MQIGTRKLERNLRSCFSATDLFAALGEYEDIISPSPINVLFVIWWKCFPCCFSSPSFPSWLNHMQKQWVVFYFFASTRTHPLLIQGSFHSCSSHLSHWLQKSCPALGRAGVEYELVPSCFSLLSLPECWQGTTILTQDPQDVPHCVLHHPTAALLF